MKRLTTFALFLFLSIPAHAISLQDDAGQQVTLAKPAQRIVALAPHIAELLFSAGAGDRLVGTVSYSDYPEAAKKIPLVGSYNQVNFEQVLALQPDIIIAWQSGNSSDTLEKLASLHLPVYLSEPKDMQAIARNIRQMGKLAGTETVANAAADAFEQQRDELARANAGKTPVRLFYQVWEDPLYTVGSGHFSRDMFALCGGQNIFADLSDPSPVVTLEAVVARNPQVILGGSHKGERDFNHWARRWNNWPSIDAVRHKQLYLVDQDIYMRSSPRAILGARDLCRILDEVRQVDGTSKPAKTL